jgi:hypothetical protein
VPLWQVVVTGAVAVALVLAVRRIRSHARRREWRRRSELQ